MKNFLRLSLLLPFIAFSEEPLYSSEISYGINEKQKIDLYEGSSDKVLIWIHGGGWLFGDKRSERWVKRFHNHFIDHEKLLFIENIWSFEKISLYKSFPFDDNFKLALSPIIDQVRLIVRESQ